MFKKEFLIIVGVLFSIALSFQNCSEVTYETALSSFVVPKQCFDLSSEEVQPKLKWDWQLEVDANTTETAFNQVMSSPVVGDLDRDGVPEVVVTMFSVDSNMHFSDNTYRSHHGKNGALRVLSGATGKTLFTVLDKDIAPAGHSTPLLVDLDGDKKLEIVYTHYLYKKIIAINSDGSLRWEFDLNGSLGACLFGHSSANLYNGPGNEIIVGNRIINELNGVPRVVKTIAGMSPGTCGSFAMSLDSSKPNEMQIISSSGVFDTNGVNIHAGAYGRVVASDIDKSTNDLELVSVGGGIVTMNNGVTGFELFKTDLNAIADLKCPNKGSVGGGAPTIGNFDVNPLTTEIAIATGRYLIILNEKGQLIDKYETQDCSSQATGITAFDFNGDKTPEILYSDEEYLRVFEIRAGKLTQVFKVINPSGTLSEYPIVADLNGDFSAEILLVANNYAAKHFYADPSEVGDRDIATVTTGIRAFEPGVENGWMPTRSSWHQFNFSHGMVDGNNNLLNSTKTDGSLSSFRNNIQLGIEESRCNQ